MAQHILVIDDEAFVRQMLQTLLERAGYAVTLAASADQGLAIMRQTRPDLVTLDLMMPVRDGLDLLVEKQADPVLRAIPCLVISAVGYRKDLERALEIGARAALSKPFSQHQLLEAVERTLGG